MAQVPLGADACGCGYSFGPNRDSSGSGQTAEATLTSEERRYESYLEARLHQALDNLRAVREECSLDKWTPEQDQKVQQALQTLQNARKELNAQRRKVTEAEREAALRTAVASANSTPRKAGTAHGVDANAVEHRPPAAPATGESPREQRANTRPATQKPAAPSTPRNVPAVRMTAAKTPRTAPSSHRAGTVHANSATRTMPAIEGFVAVDIDTSVSPAVGQPERAPQAPATKPAAGETRAAPGQPLGVTPAKNFRRHQAGLARYLFEDNAKPAPAAGKVPEMPSLQGFSPAPSDAFRAVQAAKAQNIHPSPKNTQQCPHCTATLPAEAERCGCGHDVAKASLFPEFELPVEEHAITELFRGSPRRT